MGCHKLVQFPFLIIVIFCVLPLFDFPPADAETPFRLTANDLKKFLNAGDHEQFVGGWFQVEDFNGQDQCHARPETESIRAFAFFFQIYKNGFNGGQGMTFCYLGLLDPKNNNLGITPPHIYSVSNVKGNKIAEICMKAQCNGEDNCPEYGNSPWHGFNLRQKENSRHMEVRLSTTNRSFIIPHKAIQSGQFFLKLSTHNSIFANFSTEIGPGYRPFDGRPRSPSVENKGQISVKLDRMLRDAYLATVRKGAFLKEHMGIWALAADILPHIENNILNFFVIRSECSDMNSSFLLPSDAGSMLPNGEFAPITINNITTLEKAKVSKIRGRMVGTKGFAIEFIKLQIDENELKGIRLNVDGNGTATIQACDDVQHCFGEAKWVDVAQFKEHFHVNVDFILKIKKFDNHVKISFNCKEYVDYKIGHNIAYNEQYQFIVKGDVEIYFSPLGISPPAPVKKEKFVNSSALQPKIGEGIFIRGEMENWVEIIVTLYKELPLKETSGKIFVRQMVFHAKKADMSVSVKTAKIFGGMKDANNMPKIKEDFTDFELYVELEPMGYAITFNGENVPKIPMNYEPKVDLVKISVTPAEVKDYKLIVTQKMPHLSKIRNFIDGKMIQIKGKVREDAETFDFYFIDVSKAVNYVVGDCLKDEGECQFLLKIRINFATHKTEIIDANAKIIEKFDSPFEKGKNFTVEIHATKEDSQIKFVVVDKFSKDGIAFGGDVGEFDFLELHGGILLFEEPKILDVEMTKKFSLTENEIMIHFVGGFDGVDEEVVLV